MICKYDTFNFIFRIKWFANLNYSIFKLKRFFKDWQIPATVF